MRRTRGRHTYPRQNTPAAVITAAATAVLIATVLAIALVTGATRSAATVVIPPCPTEDSAGCYWDATADVPGSNRCGADFIAATDGTIRYTGRVTQCAR